MTDDITVDGIEDDSNDDTRDSSAEGTAEPQPSLSASPTDCAIDERLSVAATGLEPGQDVTIEATFRSFGTTWIGDATFEVDDSGRVDLTEDEPITGVYEGVRPMGLVQFAERAGEDSGADGDGVAKNDLRLELRDGSDVVDAVTVTRRLAPNVERFDLDPESDGIAGELYTPPTDGPHPGVVAVHGSSGEPLGRRARMIASKGYAVLALRYFGGPSPVPDRFVKIPVSSVGNAIEWLRRRDDVTDRDVGLIGVSRGTELALLVAAQRDDVGVVVAFAPSAYGWIGDRDADQTQDGEGNDRPPSAWQVDGDPHPFLPHPGPAGEPASTDRGVRYRPMFEAFIEHATASERAAARLPVEDVAADVVLVSGSEDAVWPADEMAETIVDAMGDAPSIATQYSYAGAGHGFRVPYQPVTERAVVESDDGPDVVHGGNPAGHATADRESWRVTLEALEALRK